jgi:hypothetical protein
VVRLALVMFAAAGCDVSLGLREIGHPAPDARADAPASVPSALALWELDEGGGTTVTDSGTGSAIDLTIDRPTSVSWEPGALRVHDPVYIQSAGAATKIIEAVRASGAISVEAWIQPADAVQNGPVRIVAISPDYNTRNVMLGQEAARWAVRLRTSNTNLRGEPTIQTATVIDTAPALTHLVATGDATARVLYVDGHELARDGLGGTFDAWDLDYAVTVANESQQERLFRGTIHRIAFYDTALSAAQVSALHARGP